MSKRSLLLVPLVMLASSAGTGCGHVALEPDAATVLAIDAEAAAACERLGKTRVEVLAKVIGIPRGKDTVSSELAIMARNAALDMGGNAVVPESDIEAGKQTFGVYRCATD